jgi:hypothetical protein
VVGRRLSEGVVEVRHRAPDTREDVPLGDVSGKL